MEKCRAHERHDLAEVIAVTESSMDAMYIGKEITVSEQWMKSKGAETINIALQEKVKKVPQFVEILQKHKGKRFAEATRNEFWGIGLAFTNKEKDSEDKWTGQNVMGKLLSSL